MYYSSVFLLFGVWFVFFFQAEDGIRDLVRSRGLGDVYKRQDDAISLIEHAFVYNLPWAMEAVRVRAQAHAPVEDLSLIHI